MYRNRVCGSALLLCLGLLAPSVVRADNAQVFNGSNVNGPTWFRPIGDGPSISANNVRYHVQKFNLAVASDCYIVSAQDFDGYLHLYRNSFNPASQLTNLLAGDDDGQLGIGTTNLPGDLEDNTSNAANVLSLSAGTYFLVTSGFGENVTGSFQNTIHCASSQPRHGSCGVQFAGIPDDQEVCLIDKFQVAINNVSNSASGLGTPVRTGSSDTALFWFFNDRNWEVMVKVLNGCGINNRYWVFISGITNQRYSVQIADKNTLQVKSYTNPLGATNVFVDTSAFATCP